MGSLRLRTKFLFSLVAISAGLTSGTLLIVRYSVQKQVRAGIQQDLRNSVDTYKSFERQREDTLTRSAELLANLPNVRALMTTGDRATIQDESAEVWHQSGSDLLVMANRSEEVVTGAFDRMRTSRQKTQNEQRQLEERLRQAHKMEAVGRLAGGVAHDSNNLLTIIGGHSDLLLDRIGAVDSHRLSVEQIKKAAGRAVSMTRQLLAFSRMQVLQPRVLDLNAVVRDMGKMLPRLIGEHIEYAFQPALKLSPVKADPGQIEQVVLNLVVNSRGAMPNGEKITERTVDAIRVPENPNFTLAHKNKYGQDYVPPSSLGYAK